MYKVIIAGGRDFDDYGMLMVRCDCILEGKGDIEVVSGKQMSTDPKTGHKYGADYYGERYATSRGYAIKPFPAEWDKYGKMAGPIRNALMADYARALIAFWDGKTKGTKNMILKMKLLNKPVWVVKYRDINRYNRIT